MNVQNTTLLKPLLPRADTCDARQRYRERWSCRYLSIQTLLAPTGDRIHQLQPVAIAAYIDSLATATSGRAATPRFDDAPATKQVLL
ncbi:hypothetical protein [Myxosarcina sp. GI1(2024)]